MMLGGVGFQVGLDEARREQIDARWQADADLASARAVIEQLESLAALRDAGALTPGEFELAKRKVLGD